MHAEEEGGQGVEPEAAEEARGRGGARSSDAGSWGSAGSGRTRGGKRRKCQRDRADRAEGGADADGVGDGAEHRVR